MTCGSGSAEPTFLERRPDNVGKRRIRQPRLALGRRSKQRHLRLQGNRLEVEAVLQQDRVVLPEPFEPARQQPERGDG